MSRLSTNAAILPFKKLRVAAGCLRGISFLLLEITRHCNLTCGHCYASSSPRVPMMGRMQFPDWCRVIDQAHELGCRRVQFIGGEPTTHPDLERLLEHAVARGFKQPIVFTNATLLTDDLVRAFKRLDAEVHVSFYSDDPAVHDRFTEQSGSFEQTVDGIRRLVRHRVRVGAAIVLDDSNRGHVKRTKKFLRSLGVTVSVTDRVRGIGRGRRRVPGAETSRELCGECWSRKLCVTASGEAHPCVFSHHVRLGNVLENGIEGLVDGVRLQKFRRSMYPR